MGKAKGSKSKSGSAKAAPKCTCEEPYKCSCGNRPERPSKGHKWDPIKQEWGGKGHKQKGASGTAATVGAAAKTTTVGKTTIAQWQKLPTKLLDEACQKEGRPRPKYKSIGKYKFRVILQDAKVSKRGGDHDLILVPGQSVDNEEQARQEAALLGLLQLTPNIPHERKLPEPYKTTWLHAVQAAKEEKKNQRKKPEEKKSGISSATVDDTKPDKAHAASGGAKASTNLSLGTKFVSVADKRRQTDEKRKATKARIQHHENVRMANRDHQVFMSAKTRKLIETLLRGEAIQWHEDEETDDPGDEDTDLKAYVVERLHTEGFTKAQARTSFAQLGPVPQDESQWENVYDQCLQWLCIHLDETQLPEGFDPRGRTLDVVAAPSATKKGESQPPPSSEVTTLAGKYGLSVSDARLVVDKSSNNSTFLLWNMFLKASGASLTQGSSELSIDECKELASDEMEALQAIFMPEEVSIQTNSDSTTVTIAFPFGDNKMSLEIVVEEGKYPGLHPKRVLLSGDWPKPKLGAAVHVELIKFVADLPTGIPMIYEIFGQVQELVQAVSAGELKETHLVQPQRPDPQVTKASTAKSKPAGKSTPTRKRPFRPRQRDPFWSRAPKSTPPAEPFPDIGPAMKRARGSLPAAKARIAFLQTMKKADKGGRVVLVTGDTGCGKSTQLPQFILEDAPDAVKIVVAQPRRLAATGVATRVANERGESEAGMGSVGYVVRGARAMCDKTRLVFCTTGVLLRQLQSEKALECITHIIVDEVHERHLDTDVLLGVLKASLKTTPHLRVVLMSATLDADRFAGYWGKLTPRMHIPGRTFPVTDYMLEDVLSLTGYIPPKKGKKHFRGRGGGGRSFKKTTPWADSEHTDEEDDGENDLGSVATASTGVSGGTNPQSQTLPIDELVKRVDEGNVDYDMLGRLVKQLILNQEAGSDGSILVFLSGVPEINNAIETIRRITKGMSILLLPLHGGLQSKDQNAVFRPARTGSTKVICSTNVAETSITIPDCTIVIDSCREKQSSYDPVNRMPLLLDRFAAKSSLKQRRGRAGRVREGICYKLISRATYSRLPDHGTPEIHRCALDQTMLSLLFLGVEKGSGNFLRTLLDPPNQESLHSALLSLQKLGAVSSRDENGNISLTPLGMHLAGIPAPPTIGKMLVMGSILGCRSAALAMASGMSVGRSPFLRIDNRMKSNTDEESAEEMKRRHVLEEREETFKSVGNSDHAMLAAVYSKWHSAPKGGGGRKRVCDQLGLAFNGMKDVDQLVKQLDTALSSAGYVASSETDRNSSSWRVIRACAVAALAPSHTVRIQRPSTKYAETAEGALEKDGSARELKFFIRSSSGENTQGEAGNTNTRYHGIPEERVFIHPSSLNFSIGNYSCPWLVYHELVRTSKPFLRDATECSAYALLLFGGTLEVHAANGLIVVEGWTRLSANARIGALIGGLRQKMDELLTRKIADPTFDIVNTIEMKLIRSLLVSDGLGQ